MRNEVVDLMQDLYFDGPAAQAVLIRIGYQPAQIPTFRTAATFWPEVVLRLQSGIVIDGTRRLLTEAVRDHPGSTKAAALLSKVGGAGNGVVPGAATEPVTILSLFADPLRVSKIRIDREARLLKEIEDLGRITVKMRHAVRVTDIVRALVYEKPRILHFGGHGLRDGRLVFEDDRGAPATVGPENLAQAIMAASADLLDCVVLNSCYTAGNAEAFRGATRAVAGSVTSLKDDCALAFARGFYTVIGAGQPVAKAYAAGHAEVGLEGCATNGLHLMSFAPEGG